MIRVAKRTVGRAAAMLLAASALTGCSHLAASDNATACEPTTSFEVQREGEGSGPVITEGGIATLTVDAYDESGAKVAEGLALYEDERGEPMPGPVADLQPGLRELTRCAQAGESVAADIPNPLYFGAEAVNSGQVSADGSQRVVVHVEQVYHSAASGRIAPQQNGIPAVVNAPAGGHGVTMPNTAAPQERRQATTITGFGAKLAENDIAVVQMSAYAWTSSDLLYSSWDESGAAQRLPAVPGEVYTLGDALIGTTVGSQVVVVVPAGQLAELAGPGGAPLGNGDAVVFVVDVLGKAESSE